jgi:hypothetical protein
LGGFARFLYHLPERLGQMRSDLLGCFTTHVCIPERCHRIVETNAALCSYELGVESNGVTPQGEHPFHPLLSTCTHTHRHTRTRAHAHTHTSDDVSPKFAWSPRCRTGTQGFKCTAGHGSDQQGSRGVVDGALR